MTGDKWTGCTSGAGCEQQVWTNQCTKSSSFFLTPYDELDPRYTQWVSASAGRSVRTRQRMVNSAGNGYYYTAWVTTKTINTTHSVFVGSKRCFSEWAVRRKDGSWYTRYHYNTKFNSNQTFREICTDA